ncbi:hypothetical protein L1887_27653 [Cichorium endivia]|nr:hypothetical protein L1887_27653 [Cichorium endivia]
MDSGPQSAVDGGGGRSGGKVYKRKRTAARKTPYDRPTQPPQPESPNWFNGLVFPAKFVAGGASKLFSSIWNPKSWGSHSSSSDSDSDSGAIEDNSEDNGNLSDGGAELNQNEGSSSGKSEILYLIEQLLMLERYSREECERLIEIINSRVIDYTMREEVDIEPKSPNIHNQVIMEARKLITKNIAGSSSKSNLDNHIHGSKSLTITTPNKDYVSSGSWNIQDEIQRLRSKTTEDTLSRHQSPKLDKILEVVKPIEPVSIPEDEIVNLASDGGTLGLSDLTTTQDHGPTEAFSSLPTIEEQNQEKEVEDDVKLVEKNDDVNTESRDMADVNGSQGSSNTNDPGFTNFTNSPVTRAMARNRRYSQRGK